jgi:hypothetical protein
MQPSINLKAESGWGATDVSWVASDVAGIIEVPLCYVKRL